MKKKAQKKAKRSPQEIKALKKHLVERVEREFQKALVSIDHLSPEDQGWNRERIAHNQGLFAKQSKTGTVAQMQDWLAWARKQVAELLEHRSLC